MIGIKEVNLVFVLAVFAVIATEDDSAELFDRPYDLVMNSFERRVPDVMMKERQLSAIRTLVDSLESRMMKRMSYGGPCLGAGMSHNCEFGDLKQALKHVEQVSSGHFPGRRKRSPFHWKDRN